MLEFHDKNRFLNVPLSFRKKYFFFDVKSENLICLNHLTDYLYTLHIFIKNDFLHFSRFLWTLLGGGEKKVIKK